MLFNTLEFFVFLPIAFAGYFLLPARFRWMFLLVISYYFYACWRVSYLFLLFGSTVTDYICSRRIERSSVAKVRRRYLYASLVVNLGLLFTFKYFDFLNGSVRALVTSLGLAYPVRDLNLTLPVGISFYTFQTLGYTIDVYRGRVQAEPNFFRFALYVSYFPQLVAGPIERARNLLPQLRAQYAFSYERVRDGLSLVLWGLFKKVVIADRVAEYTHVVFGDPGSYRGMQIWLGGFLFVVQLYCDFSGYTDIAMGTASVMGVRLMENFRQPLLARNIAELWSRWHISLTTWFRDYLYGVAGSRRVRWRMYLGILIVFLANGIWHGANWTFAAFGLLHGVALIVYYGLRPRLGAWYALFRLHRFPLLTALAENLLVLWIFILGGKFFRAASLSDSWILIRNGLRFREAGAPLDLFAQPADFWLSIGLVLVLYASEWIGQEHGLAPWLAARSLWVRWGLMLAGVWCVVFLGKWATMDFIYFQF